MDNFRKNLLKYLLEMVLVSFGVFLAIYVSDTRTNSSTKKNVKNSLGFIVKELEENQKMLKYSIDYHEVVKQNLRQLRPELNPEQLKVPYFESQVFKFTKIEGWRGIMLPRFEDISFEGAKISGIFQEVNIELVQLISKAYKQIAFNQDFGQSVFDKMIGMDSDTKTIDAVGMVELLTTDVLNSEKALQAELEFIIDKIKEHID